MNAVLTLAGKEISDALRNRWVLGATLLLAGLGFALTFLGNAPAGTQLGVKPLAVTVVSLASLTIFLVPLLALLLSYDTIVGEAERGTLLLLLTYPVTRNQILAGKFLGHVAILAFATLVGYGGAGLANGLSEGGADAASWLAFGWLIVTAVMLGAVFVAIATLVSIQVHERGTAAGIAIGIWLVFVVLYDMGLLGLLVASRGQIDPALFPYLLLLDPADVFRLFNLTALDNVRNFSGMAGLSAQAALPAWLLLATLLAWIVLPLAAAVLLFRRREP